MIDWDSEESYILRFVLVIVVIVFLHIILSKFITTYVD